MAEDQIHGYLLTWKQHEPRHFICFRNGEIYTG